MDAAQLLVAFMAGALAFLSPCSFPLLPAYVSFALGRGSRRLLSGFALSASMILGFVAVFAVFGLIPYVVLSDLLGFVWVVEPVVGGGLVVFGVLIGWTDRLDSFSGFRLSADGSRASFLLYGVVYGVTSLGCSLPIFLLIVLQGVDARSLVDASTLFAAFSAGAAALIIPLTLSLTLAKSLMHERLLGVLPYMKRINGAVLVAAGAYMIYTGLIR